MTDPIFQAKYAMAREEGIDGQPGGPAHCLRIGGQGHIRQALNQNLSMGEYKITGKEAIQPVYFSKQRHILQAVAGTHVSSQRNIAHSNHFSILNALHMV